jgi:pilus assembly protein CpaE
MKPADVLLLTAQEDVAIRVRAVIESGRTGADLVVCTTIAELKSRLKKTGDGQTGAVALVDIDEDVRQTLYALGKIGSAFPHTRFVVFSERFSEDLVLQAMQVGARHFLRKKTIETELPAVLDRLISVKAETAVQAGDVIAVFSCGGGCGATTAAVNLACELHLADAKRTLIVDLDEHYGGVATHLGLKGDYGVAHVLGRTGMIDRDLIETSVTTAAEGLEVLLSPAVAKADSAEAMDYGNLLKVVDACRESHEYVIVDAPRLREQAMADLASVCGLAVVVFQLTVRDVAMAKSRVDFLTECGVARNHILPLANRVRKRGPLLRLEDSEQVIGMKPFHCVRNSWRTAVRCLSHGQPLAQGAKRSGLRRDYRKIIKKIHQRMTAGG